MNFWSRIFCVSEGGFGRRVYTGSRSWVLFFAGFGLVCWGWGSGPVYSREGVSSAEFDPEKTSSVAAAQVSLAPSAEETPLERIGQLAPEHRWEVWQRVWEAASPERRVELAETSLPVLPPARWPEFFAMAWELVPPCHPRRGQWVQLWAEQGAEAAGAEEAVRFLREAAANDADAGLWLGVAAWLARRGDAEGWRNAVREALVLEPSLPGARRQQWLASLALKDWTLARAAAQMWLDVAPQDSEAWLAVMETALLCLDSEAAEETLGRWLAGAPSLRNGKTGGNLPAVEQALWEARGKALLEFSTRMSWRQGLAAALDLLSGLRPQDSERGLELLRHLMEWREFEAAGAALERLEGLHLSDEERAHFFSEAGKLWLRYGHYQEAADALLVAWGVETFSNPEWEREVALLLTEALVGLGRRDEAIRILLNWRGQPGHSVPPPAVDRRLWDVLQEVAERGKRQPGNQFSTVIAPRDVLRGAEGKQCMDSWKSQELLGPAPFIRQARFYQWANDPEAALHVLHRGIKVWPDSRELLIETWQTARQTGRHALELETLRKLLAVDLPQRGMWEKLLADTLIRQGAEEEGIELLRKRVASSEDAAAAQRDLARALEWVGSWFSAEEAWQKALLMATDEDAVRAAQEGLAAVRGRLGDFTKGCSESGSEKSSAIQESGERVGVEGACNNLPGESGRSFSRTVEEERPGQQITTLGLGTLYARNPEAWLRAIERAEGPAKLELLEEALARFPRNRELLHRGIAEFEGVGNLRRGVDLCLRLWELEPPTAAGAIELAEKLLTVGERAKAQDILEKALDLESAVGTGRPAFPVFLKLGDEEERRAREAFVKRRFGRGSRASAWAVFAPESAEPEPSVRLRVLWWLGSLSQQAARPAIWEERWRSLESPVERVWVLAGMRDVDGLLLALEDAAGRGAAFDERAGLAYFEAALAWGDKPQWEKAFRSLKEGSRVELPERVDCFLRAWGRMAESGGLSEAMVRFWEDKLRGAGGELQGLLWPMACLAADAGEINKALELAEAAWGAIPKQEQQAAAAESLEWAARGGWSNRALEWSRKGSPDFGSLREPAAALWRARWILGDAEERAAMRAEVRRLGEEQSAAAALLIEGLEEAAVSSAAQLFAYEVMARAGSESPEALLTLLEGEMQQLWAWGMRDTALLLSEAALQLEPPLLALRGQLTQANQLGLSALAAAATVGATLPEEWEQAWESLRTRGAGAEGLLAVSAAERLEALGDWPAAKWVWTKALKHAPQQFKQQAAVGLLRAALRLHDTDGIEAALRGGGAQGPDAEKIFAQLADRKLSEGDWNGASELLDEWEKISGVQSPAFLARKLSVKLLRGERENVRAFLLPLWNHGDGNEKILAGEVLGRMALAEGRVREWEEILGGLAGLEPAAGVRLAADSLVRLRRVFAREALGDETAVSQSPPQMKPATEGFAKVIKSFYPEQESFAVLAEALAGRWEDWDVRLSKEGTMSGAELAGFVEALRWGLLSAPKSEEWRRKIHERALRGVPEKDALFWRCWEELAACPQEEWVSILRRHWEEGRGELAVGDSLLRVLARSGRAEDFREVWRQYVSQKPSEQDILAMVGFLEGMGAAPLALEIQEALTPRLRFSPREFLRRAILMAGSGKKAEARLIVSEYEKLWPLMAESLPEIVAVWAKLGEHARAAQLASVGAVRGPSSLRKQLLVMGAEAALAAGQYDWSGELLRQAAWCSGEPSVAPYLLAWLKQSGRLDVVGASEAELWLAGTERKEFRLNVARQLRQEGREEELLRWLALRPELENHPALTGRNLW